MFSHNFSLSSRFDKVVVVDLTFGIQVSRYNLR